MADENKPTKRNYRNSPVINDHNPELAKGYNSNYITFMREILPTEPTDYNNIEQLQARFDHYIDCCQRYDMKVSNLSAYAAIGIDKKTAYDWLHRVKDKRKTDFIKGVQMVCAMYREQLMADGKVNPVTGIFWQKNYDGLKDQQEVIVEAKVGEDIDANGIRDKYIAETYPIETDGTVVDES